MEAHSFGCPHLFRPPFGKKLFLLPFCLKKCADHDHVRRRQRREGIQITKRRRNMREHPAEGPPGSIIMLHDGGGDKEHIVEAVRLLLKGLTEEGYSAVTVSALLQEGEGKCPERHRMTAHLRQRPSLSGISMTMRHGWPKGGCRSTGMSLWMGVPLNTM